VRQVLGAIAQFEKTSLAAKLKAARDRKKATRGKCGEPYVASTVQAMLAA
jgi:hypothetical protein